MCTTISRRLARHAHGTKAVVPRSGRGIRRLAALIAVSLGVALLAFAGPPTSTPAQAAPGVHPGGGWVDLALGEGHTCALSAKGDVKCWGRGTNGELGDGVGAYYGKEPDSMGDALPFVDLGVGRTATALAVGEVHTCVLLDDGAVKCFGANTSGALGQGSMANLGDDPNEIGDALPAIDLGSGRRATAISAGQHHSCAVLDEGSVKCWGRNDEGQLGQGHTMDVGDGPGEMGDNLPPVDLGSGRTAVGISAGTGFTCALLDDGHVKCWGRNAEGQLGQGHTMDLGDGPGEMGDNLPPVDLGGGRTATAVDAGGFHTCALLDDHSVKCWGNAEVGQIGSGALVSMGDGPGEMGEHLPAVDLGTGRAARSIAVGRGHTCARLDDDTLKCWGFNEAGQLGLGDVSKRGDGPGEMGDSLPAIDVGSDRFATAVAVGDGHTCAALDDNGVKCWGENNHSQLGLGDGGKDHGDAPGEMGDALPRVALGTAFLVDPVGVDSFRPARLLETRAGESTVDGLQNGIGRRSAGQVTEVQVTGRVGIGHRVEAAIVNIGIVDPADNGFAVGYPCDEPQPASSTVNYRAGATIANAATIKLSATGTLCVYTHRDADMIVDIAGVISKGSTVEPITPARFLETRDAEATTDGQQQGIGRLSAGSESVVIVAGRNGVPTDAEAATINVAAITPDDNGYISAYPCGTTPPTASMVNYQAGQTIAGGATIPLGAGGAICIYTHRALHLAVDISAYTPAGAIVETNVPARLVETRAGESTVDGQQAGIGRRAAGQVTEVQVVGRAGVTGAATAGIFNIAAVNPAENGYVAAFPCDQPQPGASSLNHRAGQTVANNATIRLSPEGTICVYTHQDTDLIVDLTATIR